MGTARVSSSRARMPVDPVGNFPAKMKDFASAEVAVPFFHEKSVALLARRQRSLGDRSQTLSGAL